MAAMTRPILGVTARWRGDQPDGFAVTVAFETPDLGDHFARQLLVAFEGLDRDARWSLEVAVGHLRDVGRLPEDMRHETIRRRAVGIVAWLEERGYLVVDQHNGVVWSRAEEPPQAPAMPEAPEAQPVETAPKRGKAAARPRAAARERAKPAKKASKKPRKTPRKKSE